MSLEFRPLSIPEVILVDPHVHRDRRGFFLETYHAGKYAAGGIAGPFVQDNHSRSVHRTLRGLHAQRTRPQGKLVRAVRGRIWDVAVDIRRGSPTFRRWAGAELSEESFRQLWVPPGFAHGFVVLSEAAEVEYKCTDVYERDDEITIAWDDPEIAVGWPLDGGEPLLSERDAGAPPIAELLGRLPVYPEAAARD